MHDVEKNESEWICMRTHMASVSHGSRLSRCRSTHCPDDVSDSKFNFERKKGEDCRSGDHPARRRENKKHKNLSFRPLCVAYENMPNINMMLSDIWQKISARAPSNFILFHSLYHFLCLSLSRRADKQNNGLLEWHKQKLNTLLF